MHVTAEGHTKPTTRGCPVPVPLPSKACEPSPEPLRPRARPRQPERPPYLVAEARPGREGARASGRRGPPRLPARLEPGPRSYFWKRRPEERPPPRKGREKKRDAQVAKRLDSPPPAVIHNPADRKGRSTSLPAASLGNASPADRCGNLCFLLLMPVRVGTISKRELPGTDGVAGRSGEC